MQDLGCADRLTYIEEWENESDLMHRIGSASFKKVLALMEFSSRQPEFRIQTIHHTRGLEMIELIRNAQAAPRGRR